MKNTNNFPKISIIIITFNQEKIISRALDSVLCQKEYVHEIIVSDDCSADNTWEVVQRYKTKYPDKIKAQRHEYNLGIYENLESTYDLVTGNLIFFLSGDDAFGENLFKTTCERLALENIDYEKDKFCVITDFKVIQPNGKEKAVKNDLVKKYNPFSLKLRNIIFNRAFGESISIFNERKENSIPKRSNIKLPSVLQEAYFDIFPFYYSNSCYYLPIIGNISYRGIGISTILKNHRKERLESLIEYCEKIPFYFKNLNKHDIKWLKYEKQRALYYIAPTPKYLIKYLYMLLFITNNKFGLSFIMKEYKIFLKNILST